MKSNVKAEMKTKKKDIQKHKNILNDLNKELVEQQEKLGLLLVDGKEPAEEGVAALFKEARGIKDEISTIEDQKVKINSITRSIADKEKEIKEAASNMKKAETELSELYDDTGHKAYSLYRAGELQDYGLDDYFHDADIQMDEITEKEQELQDLEAALKAGPILKKITGVTKTTPLKNAISSLKKEMQDILKRTGEALCTAGALKEVKQEEIEELVTRFKELNTMLEENRNREAASQREIDSQKADLRSLGVDGNTGSRLKELAARVQDLDERLKKLYLNIGSAVSMQPALHKDANQDIEMAVSEISGIQGKIEHHEQDIFKLEGLIEIDELESAVEKRSSSIESLKKKIEQAQSEIAALEEDIKADKNRINEIHHTINR